MSFWKTNIYSGSQDQNGYLKIIKVQGYVLPKYLPCFQTWLYFKDAHRPVGIL